MNGMDRAIRVLEYEKVLERVAQCADTEGAVKLIMALRPTVSPKIAMMMLAQTDAAKYMIGVKGRPRFGRVPDIGDAVDRAKKGAMLSLRELLDAADVLKSAQGLRDYVSSDRIGDTVLNDVFSRLYCNTGLTVRIERSIISDELVADEASPALGDIRRKIRMANDKVRDSLHNFITSRTYSKYLQENIVTTRGGRFVIPVKSEYRGEIKGLVHDTSASGSTLFIEPMSVIETNNEIRMLQASEEKEIERIVYELSSLCADCGGGIVEDYITITMIASVFAKAEYSYRMSAVSPKINDAGRIELIKARHPLIDPDSVVPIDIAVGGDYSMLVITGPNTGGKTVSLKTLGLLSLMAQSGLHIPASDGSTVSVLSDVLADIGDEQSIEQSLSTFSSHMVNVVSIMKNAGENTLVLLDELGAGTDPVEGAALAVAILSEIKDCGALCAATTHYAEIKAFALNTDGVQNASCEFDVDTLRPTYKLITGMPGKSNAFAISRKLGLPDHIVENAKSMISSDSLHFENVLEELETLRTGLEKQKHAAEEISRAANEEYEIKTKEARRNAELAEKELVRAKNEAARIVRSAKATSEYVFAELEELKKKKERERFEEELEKSRMGIKGAVAKLEDETDNVGVQDIVEHKPLTKVSVGDTVYIPSMNQNAVVKSEPDKNGRVDLLIGNIKTKLDYSKLAEPENIPKKKKVNKESTYKLNTSAFSTEIDLRGLDTQEAWWEADRYIDSAQRVGVNSVTLLHGKGTGALRAALWQCLKNDKRVKSYRPGAYGEGDYGVTVVELR